MNEDKCPICGKRAILTFRADSMCEDGHWWHICLIHDKVVKGGSDSNTPLEECTCNER